MQSRSSFSIKIYPFIWILNGAARLILKMFNMKPAKESEVLHSEEELKQLIQDSHEGGEINDSELHHINQAFKFDNLVAKDIMIDQEHVKTLNLNTHFDDAIQQIKVDAFTRYPAIKDDQVVGFIHSKSLFNVDQPSKLATFVNLIINVKLDTPLKYILEMMKKKKVNIAAVYDDADFKGIITLKIFLKKSLAILKMNIINTTVYTDPIIEI
ncbi:CNNM domain-containing protein [Staphylococcus epidermidis]|nr:CNNM domain-containing protein [Staphylococcus epidermidis]